MSNYKHKIAINNLNESEKILSDIGLKLNDHLKSIGIFLKDNGMSQLSFLFLKNISELVTQYKCFDINLFVQQLYPNITDINCPIFQCKDLLTFNGNIITTTISTTIEALNYRINKILFYIFDIHFIQDNNLTFNKIDSIFHNKNVILITRSQEYKKIIENFYNTKLEDTIIENPNILEMAKILFKNL